MMRENNRRRGKKTIFRSLFIPLFLIMLMQGALFYLAAVYGGIEESLSKNATDILSERLQNRKNTLETQFNTKCFALDNCATTLDSIYSRYEAAYGKGEIARNPKLQIDFLSESADTLIWTLRQNEANGIFLILNNQLERTPFPGTPEKKYGLCVRDMDQDSNYTGREDLLLERSPSSIVDSLGCSLDSWWEAHYTFDTAEQGDYYYNPLNAAWDNPTARGVDLAYFAGAHQISRLDPAVVSYSIPLLTRDGYPYGVVGVELTTKYLASLLPESGLNDPDKPCYVLALADDWTNEWTTIVGVGALYNRAFGDAKTIPHEGGALWGGFNTSGRGSTQLYGMNAPIVVYNTNNPFESRRIELLAMVEADALFAYIEQIKGALLLVSLFCLLLGVCGIFLVSRHFAQPVIELARRVRDMTPEEGFKLERLGINEIDQLVDAIEELNRNVSRSSARTEFFSRMSHDMRTPMNAIISFSSPELLSGASVATKDDYLEKIHNSATYLLGLINEVLDMTKIESNKVELRRASIHAQSLCATTILIAGTLAEKKGVHFTSVVTADEDTCVMADAQHIDQIVTNLLSNAIKFTPAGGSVSLEITVADSAMEDVADCRIKVIDNGIGMSEDFLKILYVPFEQENSAHEGTGLGLSITKKLVELMGGTIRCQSKQNEGTTFTVDIPLKKGDYDEAVRQSRGQWLENTDLTPLYNKRVLVCEDNPLNTLIVRHLLDKAGILTDAAANGKQGVEAFSASELYAYDAVLMDIQMPVMDGLAATKAIRALDRPDAKTVPIIAMTANAFEEDVRASIAVGMNEHLAKPLEPQKFFEVLLALLSKERP